MSVDNDKEMLKGEQDSGSSGLTMVHGADRSSDEEIDTRQLDKDSASKSNLVRSSDQEIPTSTKEELPSTNSSWWPATGTSTSWSGWYESALSKSSAAYDLMKRDLSEFKDTLANESTTIINSTSNVMSSTVQVVSSTANYIKETVESLVDEEEVDKDENTAKSDEIIDPKVSNDENQYHYPESLTIAAADKLTSVFNSLLESILPTGPADDPDGDCVLLPGNYLVPKSRWDQLVKSIQSDPITYCHEPTGPPDDYETWLEKFNLMDHESSITYLLESSPMVADFYTQFVPKSLSSDEFWHRYFYRLHQLQEMEIQRAKLLYEKSAIRVDNSENVLESTKEETMVEAGVVKISEPKADVQSSSEAVESPVNDSTPKPSPGKTPVKVASKLGQAKATSFTKSTASVKSNKINKRVTKGVVSGKTPSPASSESTKSAKSSSEAGSSEWEKTDLNDIVDEVAKKLGDKLNKMPEPKSDEDLDQWEFE